jgi:hypothetical protein
MKRLKEQPHFAAILLFTLCGCIAAYGQITPSGDAYTNTATPTTNLGTKPLLDVESASQTTYIQFDLSSIPAGYTSASIAKATLKLYVNAVTTAGSFNVDYVNGTWSEKTITADLAPALGTTIVSSVPLTSANVHDYILIDITPAVGAWLDGTEPNDGIALVGNSPLNASFDSKENTANSQPAELDIVFAGGGTLTGVTTAGGSGLTGGGTSGTLNLGLTTSCAANQILQWNGSSWACAAVGTGTITGVTAGTGLLGGGTSGLVTLSLDPTKIPQLTGNNNFSGNESVAGGVLIGATGTPLAALDVASTQHTLIGNMGCTPSLFAGIAFGASSGTGCLNYSMLGDGSNTYLNRAAGGSILFREGNATEMTLASGGFLGIGIPAPQFPLHVNGAIRSETGLSLGGTAPVAVDAPGVVGGRFSILSNGTVGIGTTAPHSILEASVDAPAALGPALTLTNSGTGHTGAASALDFNSYAPSSSGTYNPTARIAAVDANNWSNDIVFSSNQPGAANNGLQEHMRITSAGGVSINGDTPMSSAPRMFVTAAEAGPVTQFNNCCFTYFIPDRSITVTRVTLHIGTPGNGCSPSPATMGVQGGQGGCNYGLSIPDDAALADSGPLSISCPAGKGVVVGPWFVPNSCSNTPQNVSVTVEYVMQ